MDRQNINILSVDDDKAYLEVIRHHLGPFQGKTFRVTSIQEPEKVLPALRQGNDFDLILMDYYIPGTNGVELTKAIRAESIEIPIVLLTSNKDFRIAVEAMKYGVEDYLIKEESIDTILPRTILGVIDRYKLNKKIRGFDKEQMMTAKVKEAVQELVVTMCHEFNNPLAAIKISTDILNRQAASPEQKELIRRLNENISYLEKQIVLLRDLNIEK